MCLCVGLCSGLCSLDNVWGIDMYRIAIADGGGALSHAAFAAGARSQIMTDRGSVARPFGFRTGSPHHTTGTPLHWKRVHPTASPVVPRQAL